MKTLFALTLFCFGTYAFAGNAYADVTYTTYYGHVFTQVQGPGNFGKGWKDPSGVIWSAVQSLYSNEALQPDQGQVIVDSPAVRACAKIGGKLPSRGDFMQLAYFFIGPNVNFTLENREDLLRLFPEMRRNVFWTSTINPKTQDGDIAALIFTGNTWGEYGIVKGYRTERLAVICVTR
jgi:hypothetical protein